MPKFQSQPVDKLRVFTNGAEQRKKLNITACISVVECLLYKIKAQFRYK